MYWVEFVGEDIAAQADALPPKFLAAFAELRVALEVSPWTVGEPYAPDNPSGSRQVVFGPDGDGLVLFGMRDHDKLVVIWQVLIF